MDVPNSTTRGTYTGYFEILGGGDAFAQNQISNPVSFQINAVPEPSSMLLVGSGSLALFGACGARSAANL